MSHRAATWRRPTSFVSEQEKKREGGRQTETESCGNGDLKWGSLVSGAGKQSTQNKWEVNTQPQEAINCSKDQLGPSRCPCLPLLWSCLTSRPQVCDGASRSELRKQRVVSFAQQFEAKDSHWRASKEVLYCALFVPPPTKCKSLERTITSSWRSPAFTGGEDKTGSLSCSTPSMQALSKAYCSFHTQSEQRQSKPKSIPAPTAEVQLLTVRGRKISERT